MFFSLGPSTVQSFVGIKNTVLSIAFTLEFIILMANMEQLNAKLEAISYVIYYSEVMNLEIWDLYLAVRSVLAEG